MVSRLLTLPVCRVMCVRKIVTHFGLCIVCVVELLSAEHRAPLLDLKNSLCEPFF